MAHDEGLAHQGVRLERGEEQGRLSDVFDRGEFPVDRFFEHHVLDHLGFRNAECLCLLGNLFLDQSRTHESRADDVRTHAVRRAFPAVLSYHS